MENVQHLWIRYKAAPDDVLRNRLIELYLPTVRLIALRLVANMPDSVDPEDLVSAGVFGLTEAIEDFDLARGFKFETFSFWRIRGAMIDQLRELDPVPRLVRQQNAQFAAAMAELFGRFGRPATEQEMADHLKISLAQVDKLARQAHSMPTASLSAPTWITDTQRVVSLGDALPDRRSEDPRRRSEDPRQRARRYETLSIVCKGLSRRERLLLILYYYEGVTMKEIGLTLDLSESRVSQMHTELIDRLKTTLRPESLTA